MFSYFLNGIRNIKPCKKITIEALVREIREKKNPIIEEIRNLNRNDVNYDTTKRGLKERLSNITPNCTVSQRNDNSIVQFSGYMYLDIDHLEDAKAYKDKLIEKYSGYISLICTSCSGYGLSFLIKIENEITESNFATVRNYLLTHVFSDIKFDPKPKEKSRAWFITYDPDCFYNPMASVNIPEEYLEEHDSAYKGGAKSKINTSKNDSLKNAPFPYKYMPDWMNQMRFSTKVEITNKVFDLKPIEYCEVYVGKDYKIPLGKKQQFFSQVIHNLVYLNPDIEPDYIYSYVHFLNEKHTDESTTATRTDIRRLFLMVYKGILKNGRLSPTTRIKYFHCRPKTIAPKELKELSIRMSGLYRKNESINKVQAAKKILELLGANTEINIFSNDSLIVAPQHVTQKNVHKFIDAYAKEKGIKGVGIRTVKKYWNTQPYDLESIVESENQRIEITYVPKVIMD